MIEYPDADEFKEYKQMKENGADAKTAYLKSVENGLPNLVPIRMLRKVYGLSLYEAKEIIMCHETGAKSLSEYQEKFILPALEQMVEIMEEEDRNQELGDD